MVAVTRAAVNVTPDTEESCCSSPIRDELRVEREQQWGIVALLRAESAWQTGGASAAEASASELMIRAELPPRPAERASSRSSAAMVNRPRGTAAFVVCPDPCGVHHEDRGGDVDVLRADDRRRDCFSSTSASCVAGVAVRRMGTRSETLVRVGGLDKLGLPSLSVKWVTGRCCSIYRPVASGTSFATQFPTQLQRTV
jgi:hypothetical protein